MPALLPTAILAVLISASGQRAGRSAADFSIANQAVKTSMLYEIVLGPTDIAIADAVVLLRAGLHDSSADVRIAALAATAGRTIVARWAGTSGPGGGPGPAQPTFDRRIPAEWKDDQRVLRDALEGDCEALLRHDPDDRVRYQALLAIGNLELPLQADDALPPRIVGLFVDLYRHDSSAQIRAEVVKTFRLLPNSAPEMRNVLRDALVDPSAAIRFEGLTGITPEATPAPRRLSFDEACPIVVASLTHGDSGVRLGAVQALNVFGAPAASYIHDLERLRDTDPNMQVRDSARLAIEAINRAVRSRGGP